MKENKLAKEEKVAIILVMTAAVIGNIVAIVLNPFVFQAIVNEPILQIQVHFILLIYYTKSILNLM